MRIVCTFEQCNLIVGRAIARGELPPQTDERLLLKTFIGSLYVQVFLLHQPIDETLPERVVNLVPGRATSSGKAASAPPLNQHPANQDEELDWRQAK